MEKLVLKIRSNEGYAMDQVRSHVTVGELRQYLEDLDPDMEIVTDDENNQYGANWGVVCDYYYDRCDEEEE